MKKLIAIIGIIVIVACGATKVVIDHGSVRHDNYFIDYEITKLEDDNVEVFTMLRELDRTIVVYRDTIETEEYKEKLAELYQKALDRLNEELRDE
jgi:uncharacterized protein YxeA